MFNKPITVNETDIQRELLEDLRGESASYEASIKDSIKDLKKTNASIVAEQKKTEELIKNLTKTRDELVILKESNDKLIHQLESIFVEE